jgi:tetratricopeptide (TPR) repeat protein
MKPEQLKKWGAMVVAFVTALVFLQTLWNGFVRWDDNVEIYQNPHLHSLDLSALKWMFTDTSYVWRYQPLSWFGWFLTYTFFGLNPFGYHLGNWFGHILSALIFYVILLKLAERAGAPLDPKKLVASSVVGALFWAVHPLRAEIVAWATGRLYVQSVLFFLLALFCYLQIPSANNFRLMKSGWYWAALASFAVSLLSYPTSLAFPFVVLLLKWWERDRSKPEWMTLWRSTLAALPFFLVAALVLGLSLIARFYAGARWAKPASLEDFTLLQRVAQSAYIWAYYAWRPFWPVDLSPVYTTLVAVRPFAFRFVASIVVVAAVSCMLLIKRNRWPGLAAAWFCHLIILVPHLGLTEKPHFSSDRYSAVSGLVGATVLCIALTRTGNWKRSWLICVAGVVCLAVMAMQQNSVWLNNQTFFSHILKKLGSDPYHYDIHYKMGVAAQEEGDLERAETEFLRISRNPQISFADLHIRLAKIYEARHLYSNAVTQYDLALKLKPSSPELHNELGDTLLAVGRADEAIDQYRTATRLNPNFPQAWTNLGIALAQKGLLKEAESSFRKVIELTPLQPSAHFNLALNLNAQGRTNEGAAEIQQGRKLETENQAPR